MILEEGRDFEFLYEIGLAPQFNISLPKDKIPYYLMKVEDKMVEEDLTDICRRYGKFSNPEVSDANSILYGEFKELDGDGQLKEGGTTSVTTLAIDRIKQDKNRKALIGLKKEDTADLNPMDFFGNETEVAAMLKIGKDNASLKSDYRFTVTTISHIEKAELNQELFDKLHEPGTVTTEAAFRDKIREGIAAYFERESDRKLQKDVRNKMLADTGISLPDDFLKRMLKANQEKEVEEQEFEHSYYHLAEDLRWNLIVSKIAAEQNIQLTEEEIRQLSRSIMRQQFAQYGVYDMEESRLQEMSDRYLNQEGAYEKLEIGRAHV